MRTHWNIATWRWRLVRTKPKMIYSHQAMLTVKHAVASHLATKSITRQPFHPLPSLRICIYRYVRTLSVRNGASYWPITGVQCPILNTRRGVFLVASPRPLTSSAAKKTWSSLSGEKFLVMLTPYPHLRPAWARGGGEVDIHSPLPVVSTPCLKKGGRSETFSPRSG
jgi:hypothetical protein